MRPCVQIIRLCAVVQCGGRGHHRACFRCGLAWRRPRKLRFEQIGTAWAVAERRLTPPGRRRRRRRMIVICSATASRRRLSDGSAASAASMVASEMSVTGKSRRLRRDFGHGVLVISAGRTSEVPVAVAGHQLLLARHPDTGGARLCDPGWLVGEGHGPGGFLRRQVRLHGQAGRTVHLAGDRVEPRQPAQRPDGDAALVAARASGMTSAANRCSCAGVSCSGIRLMVSNRCSAANSVMILAQMSGWSGSAGRPALSGGGLPCRGHR